MEQSAAVGPIEAQQWPDRLKAHVVQPGANPSLHGLDVQGDLAHFYHLSDLTYLALTGELPDPETSRAFSVAMMFAAPAPINEAPAHAASVARLCGANTAGITAVAATALAEQIRCMLDEHDVLIPRLVTGALNGMAVKYAARDAGERDAVARLRSALGSFCQRVPSIGYDLRLDTALIAVLLACNLTERSKIEVALTTARLPVACAEALTWKVGELREYPMDLPPFTYEASHG
jgi:hypothetical protein